MFKFINTARVAGLAALSGAVVSAHAALPSGVETAISSAQSDGVTVVGALAVAGAAVYLIAKVLGRFGLKL